MPKCMLGRQRIEPNYKTIAGNEQGSTFITHWIMKQIHIKWPYILLKSPQFGHILFAFVKYIIFSK